MKILSIHEGIVPISSSIRNAWIDFSSMDCSIVAIVSDVIVDGEPVIGYGFNSNGRYSAGEILRRRAIPRLLDAAPESLLNEAGDLDPTLAWPIMMNNEKPGGHGERSVAVGVLDMALFDLASKIAGQPLYRYLSGVTATVSPMTRSSCTPQVATTHPARPCPICRTRCAGSSTWVTPW
jgi:L-alanine-DL-glutamate epimerase-like enolase superfamily enzyme